MTKAAHTTKTTFDLAPGDIFACVVSTMDGFGTSVHLIVISLFISPPVNHHFVCPLHISICRRKCECECDSTNIGATTMELIFFQSNFSLSNHGSDCGWITGHTYVVCTSTVSSLDSHVRFI